MRTIVFRSLYWVPHLGKLPYGDTSIIIRGLYMVSWRLPCQDYNILGTKFGASVFGKPHMHFRHTLGFYARLTAAVGVLHT